MPLPNFFIAGAARSGSTSLYHGIRQHPDVFMPDRKEPRFFDSGARLSVTSIDEYSGLFEEAKTEKALGEASVSYLYDPHAAGNIKKLIPDAKIIIILRNPPDMVYSLWGMMKYALDIEKLDFEEALAAEDGRFADDRLKKDSADWFANYLYFRRGLYHDQVKRFIDTFGREQVRVYIFEEFVKDPLATYRDAFEFLGVDPSFGPEVVERNVAREFRSKTLQRIFLAVYPAVMEFHNALPAGWKKRFHSLLEYVYVKNVKRGKRQRMDEALRSALAAKYMDDIHRLEGLLGRDLSVWYGVRE